MTIDQNWAIKYQTSVDAKHREFARTDDSWVPQPHVRLAQWAYEEGCRAAAVAKAPTTQQAAGAAPATDIRRVAIELYQPPFRHEHGYIRDANDQVIADDGALGEMKGLIAARIRGWGRIQYMDNPEGRAAKLQDAVGEIVADALTAWWVADSGAAPADPAALFEDPQVQKVYELLIASESPPNPAEHREGWMARRIVDALSPAAPDTVPAASHRPPPEWYAKMIAETADDDFQIGPAFQDAPKDHEIAALVNQLRDIAIEFHDAQQLRQRIAQLVVPAFRAARTQPVAAPLTAEQGMAAEYQRWIDFYHRGDGDYTDFLRKELPQERSTS